MKEREYNRPRTEGLWATFLFLNIFFLLSFRKLYICIHMNYFFIVSILLRLPLLAADYFFPFISFLYLLYITAWWKLFCHRASDEIIS